MIKEKLIETLTEKYHPRAFILFGSYSREDYDENSDFDCLLIIDEKTEETDHSVIEGVELDCRLFTPRETRILPVQAFEEIYYGTILTDDGTGLALMKRVAAYVNKGVRTSQEYIDRKTDWYRKTLRRIDKDMTDNNFRAVRILCDSLYDYFKFRDIFFHGSKISIAYMQENDPEAYALFSRAVAQRDNESIRLWIEAMLTVPENRKK